MGQNWLRLDASKRNRRAQSSLTTTQAGSRIAAPCPGRQKEKGESMFVSRSPMKGKITSGCLLTIFVIMQVSGSIALQQAPAGVAPSAAPKAAAKAQDIGWPRQIQKNGVTLVYYQPQIDDWKDYKDLLCRVAFSLTPAGGKQVMGVANLQAGTLVDKDTHTAFIRDIQVTSVRFP